MRPLALLAVLVLTGPLAADDKNDKIDPAKLVGKWELTKAGGKVPGATVIREFTANGEMKVVITFDKRVITSEGTYKLNGSKLDTAEKRIGVAAETSRSDIVKLTDTVLHTDYGDEYERVKEENKDK
jgi:uncharacterized protein (TIGR03066 family)